MHGLQPAQLTRCLLGKATLANLFDSASAADQLCVTSPQGMLKPIVPGPEPVSGIGGPKRVELIPMDADAAEKFFETHGRTPQKGGGAAAVIIGAPEGLFFCRLFVRKPRLFGNHFRRIDI
jgi:hypothetical protein